MRIGQTIVKFLKETGESTQLESWLKMGAGFTRNSIIGKASRLGLSAKIKIGQWLQTKILMIL